MMPAAVDPDSMPVRWLDPVARNPHMGVSIPAMVSADPNPAWMGARTAMFNNDGWRADLDIDTLGEGNAGETEERSCGNEEEFLFHRCGSSFRGKILGPVLRGEI
jgi:hypothetical protein